MLPYISRVRNAYFDEVYEGDADVVISSGHSAFGDYSQAKHAIVFADWPYVDEAATVRNDSRRARALPPKGSRVSSEVSSSVAIDICRLAASSMPGWLVGAVVTTKREVRERAALSVKRSRGRLASARSVALRVGQKLLIPELTDEMRRAASRTTTTQPAPRPRPRPKNIEDIGRRPVY